MTGDYYTILDSILKFLEEFVDSQGPAFVQKWRLICRQQKAIIDSGNLGGVGLSFQQAGKDIALIVPHVMEPLLKRTLQKISDTQLKMAKQMETGQLSIPEVKTFLRKGLSELGSVLISISDL